MLFTAATPLHATQFSELVSFGDSLTDVGNAVNELGAIAQKNPEDYMGRYSNGPVWVEYLATDLGLPAPAGNTIDTANGRNYAFGGAWTQAGLFDFEHWVINDLNEQVDDFIDNDGGPTSNDLITLWAGANNLFDEQTNTQAIVNHIVSDINSLYSAGGRNFMVVNLPLLGKTPRFVGSPDEASFDAITAQFNAQLDTAIDNLETTQAEAAFFRIDAAALISAAVQSPAHFGLTNVTTPAVGLSGINVDEYLFWDDIHPTTKAHQLLADYASDILFNATNPLPGDPTGDGFVGLDDLDLILNNWNQAVPLADTRADPSGDGFVGLDDLDIVLNNWNAGTPPAASNAIPEPATISLMALGLSVMRRRSHG